MPPIVPYSTYSYDAAAEKRAVRDLSLLATKHDLSAKSAHLLAGAPAFDEICRLANTLHADLIVTSTHGWTGLKHVFLGSTAERIIQHSPCPVLVSREMSRRSKSGARASIDTILVPVDFSDCSLEGLNYAIAFAEKFAAKIILLHAIEIGSPYTADGYAMYDLTALIKAAQEDGERQMRQFVQRAKFGRVPFETVTKTESTIDAVSEVVKDRNVDLIITPTHGRTGIKHVLVGSVAEKIVRHALCPVLVVPSHPDVRKAHLSRQARPVQITKRATRRRTLQPIEAFTRKYRKLGVNPFPERRKTNKFRESHLLNK